METEQTYREEDIFPAKKFPEEGVEYQDRLTGVAIIFNNDNKLALVGNNVNDLFTLPAGGIEQGESIESGLMRECLEETGYKVSIEEKIGVIDDYRPRDSNHYTSHCYHVKTIGDQVDPSLTEEEERNGLYTKWFDPKAALEKLAAEEKMVKSGDVEFYNTAFNIVRDKYFLDKLFASNVHG